MIWSVKMPKVYSSSDFACLLNSFDKNTSFFVNLDHDAEYLSYMAWRMDSNDIASCFKEMGEGYFVGALKQIDSSMNYSRDRDVVVYPILFNIHHAIELYLKAMIIRVRDSESGIHSHFLFDLCEKLKKTVESDDRLDQDVILKDFDTVNKFLDYYYCMSSDPTYARFPSDSHGAEFFFANTNEQIIIDLQKLKEWVGVVFYILDRNYIILEAKINS